MVAYAQKYVARAGRIPIRVGRRPRKNPRKPSARAMLRATVMGPFAVRAMADPPFEAWRCVFTTSIGHVRVAEKEPAMPPAIKEANCFWFEALLVERDVLAM